MKLVSEKKDFMLPLEMSETNFTIQQSLYARSVLEKFQRSKILEVYFARLDGRIPNHIIDEEADLYNIELDAIKGFLMGQHPQDTVLQKVFRIMN